VVLFAQTNMKDLRQLLLTDPLYHFIVALTPDQRPDAERPAMIPSNIFSHTNTGEKK
jgi:hypothetical protein